MMVRLITILLLLVGVTACSNFSYYRQAVMGQMELLSARRDFKDVFSDENVTQNVKDKIKLAEEILRFADLEIGLPVDDTFSTYADVKRPFVVWNVFAAKPYSINLETYCFPVAGCVAYKGFFSKHEAKDFADGLKETGYETYMGGVAAYSSLGWFSDPLMNTFIHRSETSLAALIFHELAHKIIYVEDDTVFNESFAVTVERYALERWLVSRNQSNTYDQYIARQKRQASVIELILKTRSLLSEVYKSDKGEDREKRKGDIIDSLQDNYAVLKQSWREGHEFEFWMENDINNAKLGAVGAYQTWVGSLVKLLDQSGDFNTFIEKVHSLKNLTQEKRKVFLLTLDQ